MAMKLEDEVAYRRLAAGNTPDFRTLSDFRKTHGVALNGLFVQVLMPYAAAGDVEHGRDRHGEGLPEELQRAEGRLAKIQAAKAALEARARGRAVKDGEAGQARPAPKAKRNFTGSESRIQKSADCCRQWKRSSGTPDAPRSSCWRTRATGQTRTWRNWWRRASMAMWPANARSTVRVPRRRHAGAS
jgi:hypothetical protein